MAIPEAVIEIGSTGVRLLVAEFTADRKRNILDRSELPVSLGRDVFTSGSISRDTQIQCLVILTRFREQLAAWKIEPEDTTVIATSAFREAKNRDPVMDRILVKTGFKVKVIDGIEENRLMYLAVTECLKDEATKVRTEDSMILEAGGGSTEMMLIRKGKMAGAHSLRLGTVRIEQQMHSLTSSVDDIQRYIEEFIRNTKGSLESELNLAEVQQFIAVGSDATLAAINVGKPVSTWLWSIDRAAFDKFVDELQQYSVDECVARFKISYNEAQTLHVSLLIYKLFIHLTKVKTIIVPETNIRDGLIISKTAEPGEELQQEFNSQITASAMNLLRKYRGDEKHAEYVRKTSLKIYDLLRNEIGLGDRARLLLEVSAILHDVGMFIRLDDHNLHGAYIIRNSEIFGLSKYENTIVAEIAKYHRGRLMPQDDDQFQMLPRTDRMTILKLTAILRIADALDRGHIQKMTDMTLRLEKDTLMLQTKERNTVLEKMALAEKADMFETVFGYKLMLS
jgi:exopolyphosphatase / guanosine-5'-triphosphate,3'-diphosphate pyrophosphatase